MKKLIGLILMLMGLTIPAHAQLGNALIIPSANAPAGSCAFPQLWNRTDAQHLYYCDASTNTWVEMGASGGSTNLGTSGSVTITRPNEGTTGTTLNTLTKIVNSPQVAIKLATTDVLTGVGITTSGAGTTGNATISVIGTASCVFDNATTTNDYFVASTTVAGDCHDAGATIPNSVMVFGVVNQTNAVPATNLVTLGIGDSQNPTAVINKGKNAGTVGTVTSASIAGTTNQITATGTCTITTTGTCTLSLVEPPLTLGTSRSIAANAEIIVCTTTCSVTPLTPTSPYGQQFCVQNNDNVATVITIAAVTNIQYEATARTSYGTAGHTLTSGGAVGDQICMVAIDATHYNVFNSTGTWTNN